MTTYNNITHHNIASQNDIKEHKITHIETKHHQIS